MPRKHPSQRSDKELSNPKYRRLSDACQDVLDQVDADELPDPSPSQLRELIQATRDVMPRGTAQQGRIQSTGAARGSSSGSKFGWGILTGLVLVWAAFQFLPPEFIAPLRQLLLGG